MDSPGGGGDALAAHALEQMGYALFALRPDGIATVGGGRWIEEAGLPDSSVFFEDYIERVAGAADLGGLEPETWTENGFGMEAIALEIDGERVVAVRDLGDAFEVRRSLVQRANDEALDRRRLLKEIQKKEMLLRCIVHDLGNPLATVIMNLQRAERLIDEKDALWSVQTALAQAVRQRSMIRTVIDVFAAEIAALEDFTFEAKAAPDMVAVARSIIDAHRELAATAGVRLTFDDGGIGELPVRAEVALLERVIENLLANAVRHGGAGSEVALRIALRDGRAELAVCDEGAGVPPGMEESIFDPYVQSGPTAGQSGLGLFFCKRSIERWEGQIGCENRAARGARFWFHLYTTEPLQNAAPR